jgi:hypothetical protein
MEKSKRTAMDINQVPMNAANLGAKISTAVAYRPGEESKVRLIRSISTAVAHGYRLFAICSCVRFAV